MYRLVHLLRSSRSGSAKTGILSDPPSFVPSLGEGDQCSGIGVWTYRDRLRQGGVGRQVSLPIYHLPHCWIQYAADVAGAAGVVVS